MKKYRNRLRLISAIMIVLCVLAAPLSANAHASENERAVASRFWELFFGTEYSSAEKDIYLCPGGDAFGVKIFGSCVTVTKATDEGAHTCFRENDLIKSINGKQILSIQDVKEALAASNGQEISISVISTSSRARPRGPRRTSRCSRSSRRAVA